MKITVEISFSFKQGFHPTLRDGGHPVGGG